MQYYVCVDRVAWSVCQSVSLSITIVYKPCKSGWTNRDAVYGVYWGGPKELRIRGGLDPYGKGQYWGRKGRPIVQYRDYRPCAVGMQSFVKWLWQLVINTTSAKGSALMTRGSAQCPDSLGSSQVLAGFRGRDPMVGEGRKGYSGGENRKERWGNQT